MLSIAPREDTPLPAAPYSGKIGDGKSGRPLGLAAISTVLGTMGRDMIKAAIFDLDGTLIDSEFVALKAWERASEQMDLGLTTELIYSFIGITRITCLDMLSEFLGGNYELADEAFELHKVFENELYPEMLELKPGVEEILRGLSERGIKIALATSSRGPIMHQKFDRFGFNHYFDSMTFGDELERGKPEPDIFLFAVERLGFDPAECAVIEDSYNGVRAGHGAGCYTIMVPDIMQPTEEIRELTDVVVESLNDVIPHLEKESLLA
jgi:HAD superfamily hydrolase (TIGR01509 family)